MRVCVRRDSVTRAGPRPCCCYPRPMCRTKRTRNTHITKPIKITPMHTAAAAVGVATQTVDLLLGLLESGL